MLRIPFEVINVFVVKPLKLLMAGLLAGARALAGKEAPTEVKSYELPQHWKEQHPLAELVNSICAFMRNDVQENALEIVSAISESQGAATSQVLSELTAVRHGMAMMQAKLDELVTQNIGRASTAKDVAFATDNHSTSVLASTMARATQFEAARATQSEVILPKPCDSEVRPKRSVRAASGRCRLSLGASVSAQRLEVRTNEPSSEPCVEGKQRQKVHVLKKRLSISACVPPES
jgi:hypothetical protein